MLMHCRISLQAGTKGEGSRDVLNEMLILLQSGEQNANSKLQNAQESPHLSWLWVRVQLRPIATEEPCPAVRLFPRSGLSFSIDGYVIVC